MNELILNHRPDICQPLALASTCRLLRAYTEPLLYRVADLCYGDLRAYTEHLRLLLHYPHLARHVRLLAFSNLEDGKFEKDHCEFLTPGPNRLPQAFAHLVAQDAPLSTEEIFRQLGPEPFGIRGFHPAMFHAMFLFLLPDVRSLKIDLSFPEKSWVEGDSHIEKARREWLWRALLQWPNNVWTASKVPALQNLEEFSLVFRGKVSANTSDPRILLPFLFLPKIRILYTSSMVTFPSLPLKDRELSQWSGKSSVTDIIFDFVNVDGPSMDSILRLPTALEKLTINCNSWPVSAGPQPIPSPGIWHDSDRALGHAFSHQRHSLRKIAVRWAEACAACSIRCLETFTVLEELTCPLVMVLSQAEDGSPRSLAESLPASIVRLELLAYNHFPVPVWQLEVLDLLKGKDVLAPSLRQLRIEHWMGRGDGPMSKYELEADAVVSLGRQVGVEVQVDIVENREQEAEGTTRQRRRVVGYER